MRIIAEDFRQYGIYTYLLFGIFSVTIAPLITRFITYGELNYIVAIPGFVMYFAEFFAFKFKLKMIRLRAEIKRAEHQKITGIYLGAPHISQKMWFPLFMRIIFRMAFVAVSATAVGITTTIDKNSSGAGVIIILATVFLEILSIMHLYNISVLLHNPPSNSREEEQARKENEEWRKENIAKAQFESDPGKELCADIILHLYAFMLYAAFWEYINDFGINMIHRSFRATENAFSAGVSVFMMLLAMVTVGLVPMRLAYWIEESVNAITLKEKRSMWGYFILAILLTCAPSIMEFINIYFKK